MYQEFKVDLKEEAFFIRGKKQKTRAQKEQIINERRKQARMKYERIKKEQQKQMLEEAPISLIKPSKDEFIYRQGNMDDMIFRPDYKPARELVLNAKVQGLKGVTDFEAFDERNKNKKRQMLEQSRVVGMNAS